MSISVTTPPSCYSTQYPVPAAVSGQRGPCHMRHVVSQKSKAHMRTSHAAHWSRWCALCQLQHTKSKRCTTLIFMYSSYSVRWTRRTRPWCRAAVRPVRYDYTRCVCCVHEATSHDRSQTVLRGLTVTRPAGALLHTNFSLIGVNSWETHFTKLPCPLQ